MIMITKEHINIIFDKQILQNKDYIIHKELFNLTYNFYIDWKLIRTKKYWETLDKLDPELKRIYTLKCVKDYLKNY